VQGAIAPCFLEIFLRNGRYEHLPIYKQALDVAVHFERVVAGLAVITSYTLGRNCAR